MDPNLHAISTIKDYFNSTVMTERSKDYYLNNFLQELEIILNSKLLRISKLSKSDGFNPRATELKFIFSSTINHFSTFTVLIKIYYDDTPIELINYSITTADFASANISIKKWLESRGISYTEHIVDVMFTPTIVKDEFPQVDFKLLEDFFNLIN